MYPYIEYARVHLKLILCFLYTIICPNKTECVAREREREDRKRVKQFLNIERKFHDDERNVCS